jgi:hypothetical protein
MRSIWLFFPSYAPVISFDIEHFQYNKASDEYTFSSGELLTTNGHW